MDVPHIAGNYVTGARLLPRARRRLDAGDDAAPTEYASSLVFTTRQHSPSDHLDGRRRRLGARSPALRKAMTRYRGTAALRDYGGAGRAGN